jgi:hypothetical protein
MELYNYYIVNTSLGNRVVKYQQDMNTLPYGGFSMSNYNVDEFDIQFIVIPINSIEADEEDKIKWEDWFSKYVVGG